MNRSGDLDKEQTKKQLVLYLSLFCHKKTQYLDTQEYWTFEFLALWNCVSVVYYYSYSLTLFVTAADKIT